MYDHWDQAAYAAARWLAGIRQQDIAEELGFGPVGSRVSVMIREFVEHFVPDASRRPNYFGHPVLVEGDERKALVPDALRRFSVWKKQQRRNPTPLPPPPFRSKIDAWPLERLDYRATNVARWREVLPNWLVEQQTAYERHQAILRMRDLGWTIKKIAQHAGISISRAQQIVERAKWQRRRHQAPVIRWLAAGNADIRALAALVNR